MAKGNETSTQAQVAQQAQPQPRPCPQDCRVCGMSQQVFCTTKMLFDMSRTIQALEQKVAEIETAMDGIRAVMQKSESPEQLAIPFTE